MEHDFGLIRSWATAICVIGSSPGADREVAYAESLGLRVFQGVRAVPDLIGDDA